MWKEDKTLFTLAFFTLVFTGITLLLIWLRNDDGQSFTLFSTMSAGSWTALVKHLTEDHKTPPIGTTETKISKVETVVEDKK